MNLLLEMKENDNILSFFGVFVHQKHKFMVTELMEKGDLVQFLHSDLEITTQDLFRFSKAVASGMQFLHDLKIIHRDLAARNILVSGDIGAYKVKISDFGLSRKTEHYYKAESRFVPVRWTAPEALIWAKYSFPSDVWSFGVVLYEIYSRGSIPYAGLSNQKVMDRVTRKGLRLKPPREMNKSIGQLMLECMHENPDERPNFETVYGTLHQNSKYFIIHHSGIPDSDYPSSPTHSDKESKSDPETASPDEKFEKESTLRNNSALPQDLESTSSNHKHDFERQSDHSTESNATTFVSSKEECLKVTSNGIIDIKIIQRTKQLPSLPFEHFPNKNKEHNQSVHQFSVPYDYQETLHRTQELLEKKIQKCRTLKKKNKKLKLKLQGHKELNQKHEE